jgi:hypothetical protein
MENTMRADALTWWVNMSTWQKMKTVKNWKSTTSDSRKNWDFEMINTSSSTIERIYREVEMKENFS